MDQPPSRKDAVVASQKAAGYSLSGRRLVSVQRLVSALPARAQTSPRKTNSNKRKPSSASASLSSSGISARSGGTETDTPTMHVPELRVMPGSASKLEGSIIKHTTTSSLTGVAVMRRASGTIGVSDVIVSALVKAQQHTSLWSFEQHTNPRGTGLCTQKAFLQPRAIQAVFEPITAQAKAGPAGTKAATTSQEETGPSSISRAAPSDFTTVAVPKALMVANVDAEEFPGLVTHLRRLPKWMRCESSLLRSQSVSGMTTPQLYIKAAGAWTGAHQENILASSININHGPGTSQWACVPKWGVHLLRRALEADANPDSATPASSSSSSSSASSAAASAVVSSPALISGRDIAEEGRFFMSAAWLRRNGVPHTWFEQHPGDVVFINGGCMHWVSTVSSSIHTSWNVLRPVDVPLAAAQAAKNEATRTPLVAPLLNAMLQELCKPIQMLQPGSASLSRTAIISDTATASGVAGPGPMPRPAFTQQQQQPAWQGVATSIVCAAATREYNAVAAAKRAGLAILEAPADSKVFRCDAPDCKREIVFAFAYVTRSSSPGSSLSSSRSSSPDDSTASSKQRSKRSKALPGSKRPRKAGSAAVGVWAGGKDALFEWRTSRKRACSKHKHLLALPLESRTARFLSRARSRNNPGTRWHTLCEDNSLLVCVTCGIQAKVRHRLHAQVLVNTSALQDLVTTGRCATPAFSSLLDP